ncbi:phosphodiester glycosidase family protein [Halanaerobium hydrogeniformans]|uniref:Sporulation domain-containing protein n=1 Tax=Halanaerobium hydrogeniformans TaxID=656519 RepID=E4RPP2_HALHG|nr:phosphodiester glycosidase family protein [Halanaerobium hydrogeniformans]ADQ13926.1 Sporulation domain-containing protein [Halanaerobium hydrogeniformans]
MQKLKNLKKIGKYLFLCLALLLLFSLQAEANFFENGLQHYINSNHWLSIPVFQPADRIEIRAEKDTVLRASGQEEFELEKGRSYFITQAAQSKADGWAIQLYATAEEENALQMQEELAVQFAEEITIEKEDELYKVLIGNFAERAEVDEFREDLRAEGYEGWPRLIDSEAEQISSGELGFYTALGERLMTASIFEIEGSFDARANKLEGKYSFSLLDDQVSIRRQTDLEGLTASLLQNFLSADDPPEALKAQAVLYRTSLLYQIETQGTQMQGINNIVLREADPVFKEAAAATKDLVLIRNDSFFYDADLSLREIRKPRAGIVPLADAAYNYQEIINYYYGRAEIANLNDLMDRESRFKTNISYGLSFEEIREMSWEGPRFLTIMELNLNLDRMQLKPVLARDIVQGREDLSDLVGRYSALAGINGGFFDHTGRPLGLVYLDGQLASEPLHSRTALLIDESGKAMIEPVDWQGKVLIPELEAEISLDGVNRKAESGEAVIFNRYFGDRMPELEDDYYDIVVRSDKILGVENNSRSRTPIAPNGYIIRVHRDKEAVLALIPELKDKEIDLEMKFQPDFELNNIRYGLGGGPQLLRDGEIEITGEAERFQSDILNYRAPRTALGITENQRLIMLTVDGRQQDTSIGMTLEELAEFLQELGVKDAMNLDGGGSSRMVVRGFTMSRPSEQRLISNGIIIESTN